VGSDEAAGWWQEGELPSAFCVVLVPRLAGARLGAEAELLLGGPLSADVHDGVRANVVEGVGRVLRHVPLDMVPANELPTIYSPASNLDDVEGKTTAAGVIQEGRAMPRPPTHRGGQRPRWRGGLSWRGGHAGSKQSGQVRSAAGWVYVCMQLLVCLGACGAVGAGSGKVAAWVSNKHGYGPGWQSWLAYRRV
jgi:hypothetical protein